MPRLSKIGAAALAAFGWTGLQSVDVSYLQVAGGGGAGSGDLGSVGGAGGGAGGYLTGTTSLNPTQSYTVVVGAGGAGGVYTGSAGVSGVQGSNSQFGVLTASVGGGFGAYGTSGATGGNGGSGGGGSFGNAGGTATSGQGSNGGTGSSSLDCRGSGGGGGASAVGSNGSSAGGGNGGNGTASSITGTSVTYAGGGGGGALYRGGGFTVPTVATGGTGGGGNSGAGTGGNGNPGTANLGGGGGGPVSVNAGTFLNGGNGGSGVVIISYPSPQKFGGGIVTASGGNTIHTFTTSGTLSPLSTLTANFLVVAGGGAGGAFGGAGGGGGLRTSAGTSGGGASAESALTIDTNSIYLVTVGAGGTGAASRSVRGTNGTNSAFFSVSSVGGGAGGSDNSNSYSAAICDGVTGGSGGGSSYASPQVAGSGTANQGFAGAIGGVSTNIYGGSGGGAGSVGGAFTGGGAAGTGGSGVSSSISGASVGYAGGGGGSSSSASGGGTASSGGGAGGLGGAGTAGTAGLGGGGGGSWAGTGVNGGSGVVIISYAGSTQLMAGGTVTISGGNVIHTFTSSGYLTPLTLVGNSLRFRGSASAYLNRTPTVSGNRKTWTFSTWLKRGTFGTFAGVFGVGVTSNGGYASVFNCIRFTDANVLSIFEYDINTATTFYRLDTTQVFRDPAAWYHIVFAFDSTQATASNRWKLYVNGTQVTAFSSTTYPSQNYDTLINTAAKQNDIGVVTNVYLDGYLTEVQLIDGQALTPNSFGTFNQFGVWQPIRYGGSYGTNGFYLPFTANSSFIGNFVSNQGLTFTPTSSIVFGSNDYTVEAWVYFNGTAGTQVVYQSGSSGTNNFYFSCQAGQLGVGTTAVFISAQATTFTAGRWYHIAACRASGTLRLFVNGNQIGSSVTDSTSWLAAGTGSVGYAQYINSQFLNGSISNLRVVNGTALYTSNFIPSTTSLTAVTNTQLLTCQSATFVDNSPNAYALTNVGSATIGQSYPFAMLNDVVRDFGPAGNNWTSNNIGELTGPTLDTMTDVPTLTSTTAANYCTLNPLRNTIAGYGVISNGNLRVAATQSVNNCTAAGTMAFAEKMYCEITIQTVGNDLTTQGVGLIPINNEQFATAGNMGTGIYYLVNGNKRVTTTTSAYGSSYTSGDVIGIAVDVPAQTVTFYKNNVSQGSISGTGIISNGVLPYIGFQDSGTPVVTANFGQQPFAYTPPSGFLPLNTFNL